MLNFKKRSPSILDSRVIRSMVEGGLSHHATRLCEVVFSCKVSELCCHLILDNATVFNSAAMCLHVTVFYYMDFACLVAIQLFNASMFVSVFNSYASECVF